MAEIKRYTKSPKIIGLIISTLMILSLGACSLSDNPYPYSSNPYDDVYETTFYSDNSSWVVTSKTCPYIEGNAIIITNYWWQEFDEEGNEEWIRYESDLSRLIMPINKLSAEIIHLTNANSAHVVKAWSWEDNICRK